jgi:Transcriptional activator of acetoin/glycerol metabolism
VLKNYKWPGNVRELENVVQRSYYLAKDGVISGELVPDYIKDITKHTIKCIDCGDTESAVKIQTMEQIEKEHIIKALKYCNGNVVKASKLIDVGKSTLYRKIKRYNLDIEEN